MCMAGDFNLIAEAKDKSNANINRGLLNAFRRFIDDAELQDLYLHGHRYTWSNEQLNVTMVRLDHVLVSEEWAYQHPSSLLEALSSVASDHCPLLLNCNNSFRPCRRFRFENCWTKLEGFETGVQSAWNTPVNAYENDPILKLHIKLSRTAKALKSWSAALFSDLKLRSAITNELIFQLDVARDSRQLSHEEHMFRRQLKVQALGLAALD